MSQSLHRSRALTEIVIAHPQREDILATPVEMIAETHNRCDSRLADGGTADRRRKVPDYIRGAGRIGSRDTHLGSQLVVAPERMDYLAGEVVRLRMTTVNVKNGRGTH
jgi:hypothetical protein